MYKLVVYLKFSTVLDGRQIFHSGNQTFRELEADICYLALELFEEQFYQAGWELLEKREISLTGGVPCGSGR